VLPGGTAIASVGSPGRRQPFFRSVAQIGRQTTQGLAYAHARGIVHRDIKPSNLMLDTAGVVWITDFGLAKAEDDGLTATGDILGTLRYMAPERFRGGGDARADIYALGLTLYELLTLRPAYDSNDRLQLIEMVKAEEPARPRSLDARIPRDLETIVLKAIDKDPTRRYATAEAMAEDLRRFLDDESIQARRASAAERYARWARHHPGIAILGAVLTAVLVMATVASVIAASRFREQWLRAEFKTREANEKTQALEQQLYIKRVNLAQRDYQDDVASAERLLDQCPADLRAWEWRYLQRLVHLDLRTLRGHSASVNAVAFSPDGKRVVSGGGRPYQHPRSQDRAELILWSTATGRELVRFPGRTGAVHGVAFSPDGKRIASASGSYGPPSEVEGCVTVWDARAGTILLEKTERLLNPLSVAYSPDGRLLAAGFGIWSDEHFPGRLRVWDATGSEVFTGDAPPGGVNHVAFSPDGKTIAAACSGLIQLWDVEPPRKLRELKGHTGSIFGVAFSPDGKRLATAGWDRTVKLWDPRTGAELLAIDQSDGRGNGVAFSPDGRTLAVAGDDHLVQTWDAATGRALGELRGHESAVLDVAFSPDGGSLASAGEDGTVRIWGAAPDRRSVLKGHTGMVMGVAFSPDARRVATASGDGTVGVWETATGDRVLRLAGGMGWVNSVAYSPDGGRIASAGEYAATQVWDAATGRLLRAVEHLDGYVRAVAFSPDGRTLAAGTGVYDYERNIAGSVYIWDAASGREILRFRGHAGRVLCLAFSPDGRRIASGGGSPEDRPHPSDEVLLWETTTGKVVHRLGRHSRRINGLAFSRDGRWLASAGEDGTVRIWDVTTGSLARSLRGSSRG
jgi:WD40 repeat protein